MSDIIQLLPDSVANQIAAGEVIQRPASVVKELVENAVDAGAHNIHVLVVDAGRTSIQVIDDGKGMSETDARLAFERHATSKIRKAADLFALHTMGFRGEALPSIAAVSQVELKTRTPDSQIGTRLCISGGKFVSQEPEGCPAGSNFMIENLFFNVPARRKFLKSNTTELNNILAAFERIALVYPNIAFTMHSNQVELFSLPASNRRQRIIDIFGRKTNQELLPLNVDTTLCKISGFVGKPEAARKKNAHQYFFVNERYMKHPYFHKAVMSAYERLVPAGEQVPYFIYFDVNPADIDVNIHPTKTEIKFENEQAIWQILSAAVKESLGRFNDVTAIDFDTQGKPEIPVFNPVQNIEAPKVQYNPQYNPFRQTPATSAPKAPDQWQELYQGLEKPAQAEPALFTQPAEKSKDEPLTAEKSPSHYQYKGKYIMTAVKSGLMIIDQHRAHVRILYEQYMRDLGSHHEASQKVLFPEVVQFPASEQVVLQKILPDMERMGFELSDLGNCSYAVNGIPSGLDGLNPVRLVSDMIGAAVERGTTAEADIRKALALSLARNAAIPYGQVLSNDEMENLVNELFACGNVNYAPDGNRILSILKQEEIEHLLG